MQFYSFVKNIDNILCTFDKNCDELPVKPQVVEQKEDKPLVQFKEDNTPQMQLGLFASVVKETVETETYDSKTISDVNELNNIVQELLKKEEIALTFVSDFENAVTIDLIGCAIAYKDENEKIQSVYVANKDGLIEGLKPVFENENLKKYTYNAKNDINILKTIDIDLKNISFDTVLASYIKNPNRSHDLNAQALDYINHISFELDFPTKNTKFAQLQQTDFITYAQDNAFSIYKLTQFWLKDLSPEELKLHDEVELPLTHILAQMEYDGVALDVDYMSELSEYMTQKAEDLQAKIYEIAGEEFNINSPKQVGEVLYEKLNIQLKKKRGKAKPSTNVEVLEELASEYPICRYLIDYRKYTKLRTTYTDALPLLVSLKDRRIHTTYNQTVTATGRLSSSNPNLQNIPIRTEEGNKLRNAFIAENENDFILSSDYSQIELRLLAHVSGDENLISAFNSDVDVHSLTASKVFDVPVEQVTKEMRYKSKAVNFGIIYGQTRYGLAKALDIPAQEAQNFIDKYFMTYPKVKDYMENTVAFAYEHGFVETIFGRKRYLPELASPNRMIKEFAERAAINQPLQGTAADLIKMAMINVDKVFKENNLKSKMVMQVHDELVFEVVADELEQVKTLVKQEMQNVANLKVPLLVDINWGKSWKEQ